MDFDKRSIERKGKTVVLGIGNPVLSDDSVGIKVAKKLEGLVDTHILMTTDFDVLDALYGYERAFIIDGIRLGDAPGTIKEISPKDLSHTLTYSGSHNISLSSTLKIGMEILGNDMPKDIRIFTIELLDTETFGTDCTPMVQKAIDEVVKRIVSLLNNSERNKV
ncbi:hydrogenase maturation protease [Thermodesulfobium narugense DSM 14796]|uniref:Hydrogenase maturation protease n=1 Tax=Thermodesulfobium narugense DSM 14796 TaxID=747365 RepID=M1E842_9BACT|nr:hydrogenase maturation protease [Thermodesulfobium narugense]AEE14943.1 hydrogenase maturation protease [Thermodesulfobium narugense DSM 14796]